MCVTVICELFEYFFPFKIIQTIYIVHVEVLILIFFLTIFVNYFIDFKNMFFSNSNSVVYNVYYI